MIDKEDLAELMRDEKQAKHEETLRDMAEEAEATRSDYDEEMRDKGLCESDFM